MRLICKISRSLVIRLFSLFLLAVVALDAYAYKPNVARDTINGLIFEYVYGAQTKPRIYLQPSQLSAFLTDVACASPEEIASAEVELKQWVGNTKFTTVLMFVDYKNIDRDDEYYVATYKKAGGVIDAVLLGVTYDMRKIASGRYLFPQFGYYHIADKGLGNLKLEDNSVKVARRFITNYGVDKENFTDIEEGDIAATYSVDAGGKISVTVVKKSQRCKKHELDETTGRTKVTKHEDFISLGLGMAVIEAYFRPSSYALTPAEYQKIEAELKALEANQDIKASDDAYQDLLKMKDVIEKWQRNLIYQNPQKWLNWYYKNKTAPLDMLKRNIAADVNFAKFMSAEVDKIKVKAQRKWWKIHVK